METRENPQRVHWENPQRVDWLASTCSISLTPFLLNPPPGDQGMGRRRHENVARFFFFGELALLSIRLFFFSSPLHPPDRAARPVLSARVEARQKLPGGSFFLVSFFLILLLFYIT